MKGIIIYGNPMWGDNERATYCEFMNEASFDLKTISKDQIGQCGHYIWKVGECKKIVSRLEGEASEKSKAVCSKDDAYDFETGALIALMKMCGKEKVLKAVEELYFLKEPRGADLDGDVLESKVEYMAKEIKRLKEKNAELLGAKGALNYIKSCNESTINSLENTRYLLINKNNELIEENKELKKNIDELFESEQHSKSELGRLYFEKHRLEEKVEKLKLDCEKLQHGYVDTDVMLCAARQNGKQYTFLVDLFKKIDQKKVDAAYKEAYNTTLPVWQKEALRQAYEIRKESKEKTELPRTLDINGVTYRKTIQIKDFGEQINKLTVDSLIEQSRTFTRKCVDEWIKPPTKREETWYKIFELHKENDVIIEVKKEDVKTFLHEIEDKLPEITWASDNKIFEAKGTIKDIYDELKTHNRIYFRLSKKNKLSYSSDLNTYLFINLDIISYLPPMRWDLFKKGRLAVKVTYDNYKEFYEACEKELGKKPLTNFACIFTGSICKDDGFFEIFTVEDQKKTGRKIVDWEDVR